MSLQRRIMSFSPISEVCDGTVSLIILVVYADLKPVPRYVLYESDIIALVPFDDPKGVPIRYLIEKTAICSFGEKSADCH